MILIGALGVHIQRRSDIGVPEPLLRHFGRGSLADQQGRRGSPQIMERQFGESDRHSLVNMAQLLQFNKFVDSSNGQKPLRMVRK